MFGGGEGAPAEERFVYYHFPDGNASIARMLIRSLIRGSAPGSTMEDIVTAKMVYTRLDRAGSNVRIRLNSTAVHVQYLGDAAGAREVQVTYLSDGKAHNAKAGGCVLACYNMIIPYLCADLPQKQKEGLALGAKVPLAYADVQLRNWDSLKKLGLAMVYCPGSYFSEVYMDFPVSMGGFHYTRTPDEPVVLHMVRVPCSPVCPRGSSAALDGWNCTRHASRSSSTTSASSCAECWARRIRQAAIDEAYRAVRN